MIDLKAYEKLNLIQNELKVPKNQYNSFGKYKFRNCEDILEALKPLCEKYKVVVNLSDDIILVGDRVYIKSIAKLINCDTEKVIESSIGIAKEAHQKKGFDDSQLTGAASTYARKYALNGLFAIDDNKDADTDNYDNNDKVTITDENPIIEDKHIKCIYAKTREILLSDDNIKKVIKDKFKVNSKKELRIEGFKWLMNYIDQMITPELHKKIMVLMDKKGKDLKDLDIFIKKWKLEGIEWMNKPQANQIIEKLNKLPDKGE